MTMEHRNTIITIFMIIYWVNAESQHNRFDDFDWKLTKKLGLKEQGNIILSPISVKLVLAMLYEGAGGNTSLQLKTALNLEDDNFSKNKFSQILKSLQTSHPGYDMDVGTKLFVDIEAKPKPDFVKKIGSLYNATIDKVDFNNTAKAVKTINSWAKAVTKGHIQHLLSDIDSRENTAILLINAIYFKGIWEKPFPSNQTADGFFYRNINELVPTQYMSAVHNLKYFESTDLQAKIIRLPYVGGKFSMYLILPFERNGLINVIKNLNPFLLRRILPEMEENSVHVRMPKFKFEYASSLSQILQEMGITDMFSTNADLKGIAESAKELLVSNVIQKVGFEVNEQGSTAYAATVVDLVSKFGEHVFDFDASHPFVYFVQDETTKTVVFVGKMSDPKSIGNPQVSGIQDNPQVLLSSEGNLNRYGQKLDQQTFSYFDIELAQKLHVQSNGKNWVVSPASIKTLIALILEGANGQTLKELCYVLRLPENKLEAQLHLQDFQNELNTLSKDVITKSASRILIRNKIEPSYSELASKKYGANVFVTDFSKTDLLAKEVNDWVNKTTDGVIPFLVDQTSFSAGTYMALLNAIYFKADWKIDFPPLANRIDCFYTNGNCSKATYMSTSGFFRIGFVPNLNAHLLELPYTDARFSMIILLPTERDGLRQTMRNLPFSSILSIIEALPYSETTVTIPKFSIEYQIALDDVLQKLGAVTMYSDHSDLSDMLGPTAGGKISKILHKAKIVVDEKGTIAGAGTAALVETLNSQSTEKFKADHPFMYFIRDSSFGFLFEGQFLVPESSKDDLDGIPLSSAYKQTLTSGHAWSLAYPLQPTRNKIKA